MSSSSHRSHLAYADGDTQLDGETDLELSGRAMRYLFLANFDKGLNLVSRPSRVKHDTSESASPLLPATQSFICFTQALVTYESTKIQQALNFWKQLEKLCASSKNSSVEDKLEQRVLVADSKICSTFLQLLQSADFGGLFKGGWSIRQAWKLYQTAYEDLLKLIDGEHKAGKLSQTQVSALLSKLPAQKSSVTSSSTSQNLSDGVKRKSDAGDDYEPDNGNSEESDEFVDALSDQPLETSRTTADSFGNPNVQFERLHQILGSVCYGYGCFHLMLSLLPGNLLKWLKYLGFEGDLNTGIQALTYCMNSPDSKALLARITLIWFYTIIQTYYAVQEREMEEGIAQASALLNGLDPELRSSPFMCFFDCRLKRFQEDIDGSIALYRKAEAASHHVKEINVLVLHELGILRFQMRQWEMALEPLTRCFNEGRWGKSLYAYLMGICYTMMSNPKKGRELIGQVPALNVMKNAPLELFLADRSAILMKEPAASFAAVASLLAMEIMYFHNCPQYVPVDVVRSSVAALDEVRSGGFMGLRWLMHGRLMEAESKPDRAEQSYRDAIKLGENIKGGEHVPAFACYELGVLLSRNPQKFQEGRAFLQKANDSYQKCHFRNRLHMRIHLAKKAFDQ